MTQTAINKGEMKMEDLERIRGQIEGKRVVSVGGGGEKLVLDDGTVLWLHMTDSDCCAYAKGEWVIQPDALEAVITNVKLDLLADREDNGDGATSRAQITILHNQNPIALADCYADDGNGGYYFSVLTMTVEVPGSDPVDMEIVSA